MKAISSAKISIHLLFWVIYILILFVFDPPYFEELEMAWYEKIELGMLVLVAGIAYLNEQILLPYFLKRKYYWLYGFLVVNLLFFSTLFYCDFLMLEACTFSTCLSNNLWIISLPLIFFSFIWMFLQFYNKQKELEEAQKERLKMELKFLKSQINPHVLFNSLNTIYAQAIKENEGIAEMILMLSENLKYVLNQSTDTLVDLEKDIAFIENYLEFQELRTEGVNRIIYKKEIDSYNHSIAPLILIDLIENAFKHAVYKDDEPSDIEIFLRVKDQQLHFQCKNEFDPNSNEEKEESTEIGLKNLHHRLRLIYADLYTLNISRDNGFFRVELKINLA